VIQVIFLSLVKDDFYRIKNLFMQITILGVENIRRKELEKKVKTALKNLSCVADIQVISLLDDILKYDVTGIPALLVDEEIVCQKSIPDERKLLKCLKKIIKKKTSDKIDLTLLA